MINPGDIRVFPSTDDTNYYGVGGSFCLILKARQADEWVDLLADGNIIEGFGYTWVLNNSYPVNEAR